MQAAPHTFLSPVSWLSPRGEIIKRRIYSVKRADLARVYMLGPAREFTNHVNKIECACGEISHCVVLNAAEITGRRLSDVIWLPFNELGKIALGGIQN
jgi:hypothetical protein